MGKPTGKPTGRPRKEIGDKAIESIIVRLNSEDFGIIKKYSDVRKISPSKVLAMFFVDSGCFAHEVSDEIFDDLLQRPEMMMTVSLRIPRNDVNIIRCWIKKEERKSFVYHAIVKHQVSPTVLANNLTKNLIATIKTKSEKNK